MFGQSEYFDDCEICRAMKKADESGRLMSLGEIKAAFRKQKESGVGYTFIEEDVE